jgi:hypothetical protein
LFAVKAGKIFAGIDAAAANMAAIPAPAKPGRMGIVMAEAVAKLGAFPDGLARAPHGCTEALSAPCGNSVEQLPHSHTARCRCGWLMGAHAKAVR